MGRDRYLTANQSTDMEDLYQREFTETELLFMKMDNLSGFQDRISEKMKNNWPAEFIGGFKSFLSDQIKTILEMERRLFSEHSLESLNLLQSVIKQLKTIEKYEPIDFEVIPSFLFNEEDDLNNGLIYQIEEVATSRVQSISSAVDEENDDSTDVITFQCKEIGKSEVNGFDSKNHVQMLKVSCENPENSLELIIINIKLNFQYHFYVGLDDSRSIYDRGKYAVVPSNIFGKLVLSHGFQPDFGFIDSITPLFVNDVEIHVDGKLFVKMPESVTWNWGSGSGRDDSLLQLKQGKVSYTIIIDESLLIVMNSSHWIYDRGKALDSAREYFSFYFDNTSEFRVHKITYWVTVLIGSILMGVYDSDSIRKLILEHLCRSDLLFEYPNAYSYAENCDSLELFKKMLHQVNGCDYVLFSMELLGLLGSIFSGISWYGDHLLLQLKSGWVMERKVEGGQYMCCYCCEVFNLLSTCVKPHTFCTFTIFYQGFYQMHRKTSVYLLLKQWGDTGFFLHFTLLIPKGSGSLMVREVITGVMHYWNYWHLPCCTQYLTSSCNQVTSIYSFLWARHYFLVTFNPDVCYIKRNEAYSWTEFLARTVGTKALFMVVRALKVYFLSGNYLKWKFRLVSAELWSTRNTIGTIWPRIDLSVISVSLGYGRLLFDRGKQLDIVVMTFSPINDAILNCVLAGISTMVRILHGFTPREFFTEIYDVTCVNMFLYEMQTHPVVHHQIEVSLQLASKWSVHCQILEVDGMVKQLLHLIVSKVKREFTGGSISACTTVTFEDMRPIYLDALRTHEFQFLVRLEGVTISIRDLQGGRLLGLVGCALKPHTRTHFCYGYWASHVLHTIDYIIYPYCYSKASRYRRTAVLILQLLVLHLTRILEDKDSFKGSGMSCTRHGKGVPIAYYSL